MSDLWANCGEYSFNVSSTTVCGQKITFLQFTSLIIGMIILLVGFVITPIIQSMLKYVCYLLFSSIPRPNRVKIPAHLPHHSTTSLPYTQTGFEIALVGSATQSHVNNFMSFRGYEVPRTVSGQLGYHLLSHVSLEAVRYKSELHDTQMLIWNLQSQLSHGLRRVSQPLITPNWAGWRCFWREIGRNSRELVISHVTLSLLYLCLGVILPLFPLIFPAPNHAVEDKYKYLLVSLHCLIGIDLWFEMSSFYKTYRELNQHDANDPDNPDNPNNLDNSGRVNSLLRSNSPDVMKCLYPEARSQQFISRLFQLTLWYLFIHLLTVDMTAH